MNYTHSRASQSQVSSNSTQSQSRTASYWSLAPVYRDTAKPATRPSARYSLSFPCTAIDRPSARTQQLNCPSVHRNLPSCTAKARGPPQYTDHFTTNLSHGFLGPVELLSHGFFRPCRTLASRVFTPCRTHRRRLQTCWKQEKRRGKTDIKDKKTDNEKTTQSDRTGFWPPNTSGGPWY